MNISRPARFIIAVTMAFTVMFAIPALAATTGTGSLRLSGASFPDFSFQIPIGTMAGIKGSEMVDGTAIATYIGTVYQWGVAFAAVLAVLAFTYAGVLWLIAGGDAGKVTESKKVMGNALIGLLLALGSYMLLWAVKPELVQFAPIKIESIQKIDLDLDFESVEKYGEETGDAPKPGEEEIEFGDEGEEYSFNYLQLLAMPVYAEAKSGKFKNSGTLARIDTYIENNRQFGLPQDRCLSWTRLSLESIFGKKIKESAIYPREEYPALTAKHFYNMNTYIRGGSLTGIKNGDVIFMRTAHSKLVTGHHDGGPGGDSISHIGIYYNGHIYHQYGSRLSKDVADEGVLKDRISAKGDKVEILAYGRMGL